jgi:hypothetical protein
MFGFAIRGASRRHLPPEKIPYPANKKTRRTPSRLLTGSAISVIVIVIY